MKLKPPYLLKPKTAVNLSKLPTADPGAYKSEEDAAPVFQKHRSVLSKLQEVLYASQQKSLLVVLQGMDTAGKDGTIRHIFSGINPQGCDVTSFKVPTPLEASHDFLWRVHKAVPPRGMIGIFNRSHYEDVLSPFVHKVISSKTMDERLEDINEFEEMLTDNGVAILKFFLHISRKEQAARLKARLDDKDKHWKLSAADFHERQYWNSYQDTYERIFQATSKKHAPWYIIPSDLKWYRNISISGVLVDTMQSLKLTYPKPTVDISTLKL
jgi:PPK2 family polyphosphate:nucleotide phosphotransferase